MFMGDKSHIKYALNIKKDVQRNRDTRHRNKYWSGCVEKL